VAQFCNVFGAVETSGTFRDKMYTFFSYPSNPDLFLSNRWYGLMLRTTFWTLFIILVPCMKSVSAEGSISIFRRGLGAVPTTLGHWDVRVALAGILEESDCVRLKM
jgi:hypothetical protein